MLQCNAKGIHLIIIDTTVVYSEVQQLIETNGVKLIKCSEMEGIELVTYLTLLDEENQFNQ